MDARRKGLTVVLRMLCAVAILSLAFAHRPPEVMAAALQTASLQLPDGSLAELCVGEKAVKHPQANPLCEACRLSAAAVLPGPDNHFWLISFFASLSNVPRSATGMAVAVALEQARARGPPIFS